MQTILLYIGIAFVVVAAGLAAGAVVAYRKLDIRAVRDDLSGRARQSEVRQRQAEAGRPRTAASRGRRGEAPTPEPATVASVAGGEPVEPTVSRGSSTSAPVPAREPVHPTVAQPAAAPARPAAAPAPPVQDEAPTIIEPLFDEPTSMLTAPMVSEPEGPASRLQGAPSVQFAVTKCEIAPDRVDVLEVEE